MTALPVEQGNGPHSEDGAVAAVEAAHGSTRLTDSRHEGHQDGVRHADSTLHLAACSLLERLSKAGPITLPFYEKQREKERSLGMALRLCVVETGSQPYCPESWSAQHFATLQSVSCVVVVLDIVTVIFIKRTVL